jgi:hypothetical protein
MREDFAKGMPTPLWAAERGCEKLHPNLLGI